MNKEQEEQFYKRLLNADNFRYVGYNKWAYFRNIELKENKCTSKAIGIVSDKTHSIIQKRIKLKSLMKKL